MNDERNDPRDRDSTGERSPRSTSGLGTVAALAGVAYLLLLVVVNSGRIDVDLVVYTFRDTPLWWFTVLVVALTLVTDRLVRFVLRRRRKRRDD